MVTKTATIIIEVDDKSLVELNSEIKALENSISKLAVGTKEWVAANQKLGALKGQFSAATNEAKKLQGAVADLGSAERIRSVAKLGAGMVGAFSAASGAAKLLGGNAKAWDEMTAKAATLMSIMGGLNQVSELFSKGTLTGLSSLGKGFGSLVRTVKTASIGMKTALISTGIGALVVGVGLLIANFEKLKNLVTGNTAGKIAEKNLKTAEEEQKVVTETGKAKVAQIALDQANNKAQGDAYALAQKNLAAQQSALEDKRAESKVNKANLDILKIEEEKLAKKVNYENTIWNKGIQRRKKENADALELNKAKQETLDLEEQTLEVLTRNAELQSFVSEAIDKSTKSIADLNNQLTILQATQYESQKIYLKQVELIDAEIAGIQLLVDENNNLTKADERRIKALEAQKTALKLQNDYRKEELNLNVLLLTQEIDRNREVDKYNQQVYESTKFITEQYNIEKERQRILENNLSLIELDKKGIEAGRELRDKMVNFDLKRNKILKDRLEELYPSELKMTKEIYNQINRFLSAYAQIDELKSFDEFKILAKTLTDNFKSQLTSQFGLNIEYEKQSKWAKQLIDDAAQNLAIKQFEANFQVDAIQKQVLAVEKQKEEAQKLSETYGGITKNLIEQKKLIDDRLTAEKGNLPGKNAEEQYAILQKINKLENDSAALQQQINSASDDTLNAKNEEAVLDKQLIDLEYQKQNAIASVDDEQTKVTENLQDQLRLSQQLNDFVNKYSEEIQVSQQLLAQSIELIASIQDRKAANAQERIDSYTEQLQELTDEEDARAERMLAYEEELKDANGERYDELLQLIDDEKNAQLAADADKENSRAAIEAKIKDEENKKLAAEARAAKWRKAQAIVDAVIQGALGVIKALPNVFLAVATGVLAAAGIATIAAQKTPPIPEGYAEGGFTGRGGKHEVAGVVHKGEYVAPQYVVNSPSAQAHIQALEAQRLRGYETGGMVTPNLNAGSNNFIDYDRLISGIAGALSTMPNPIVSVVKISDAQNEVKLTKQQAGLTR